MNCDVLTDAIVDLARELDVESPSAAEVQAHLAECAACAARFQRERSLSAGLRALSKTVATELPSDNVRRRLLEQFAERQPVPSIAVAPARSKFSGWSAAAAAVLVASVSTVVLWRIAAPTPQRDTRGTPPSTPLVRPSSADPVLSTAAPSGGGQRSDAPLTTDPADRGKPRPPTDAATRPAEFVPLPGAASLPAFESGQIVRMELPVASLPLYGVEILPDTRHNPVQADLLVGQDGQARAIRLVRLSATTGAGKP